jgi:hypothetical protein
VILSNNYVIFGNKYLYRNVEREGKERGVKKKLGVTVRSMNNEMHLFIIGNQYLQIIEIHAKLQLLSRFTHDAKYMFYTKFVLHVMVEE